MISFQKFGQISKRKKSSKDADKFRNEKNKYEKYFSDKPGE